MPENTLNTKDTQLIQAIQTSHLRDDQKKDLAQLVPQMTEAERKELIAIIEDSNKTAQQFEEKKAEALKKVNREYDAKIKAAAREENEYAMKAMEKFDQDQSKEDLEKVETEMESDAVRSAKTGEQLGMINNKNDKPKNHGLRNAILLFLALLITISLIITALMML
jgi:hypothetical protein